MSSAICIIPARGGSRRIPHKNIKDFCGKPIIAYSIETAKQSGLFDKIIVSSNDAEIIQIGIEYGATNSHIRTDEMAEDEVGTQEVVASVLRDIEISNGHICCIYPTAPLMSVDDLKHGFNVINCIGDFTYAFSVGTNPLCDAGQFYWGWAMSFWENIPLFNYESAMIPISDERVCDINTMEDFSRAEEMYKALHP